MKKHAHWIGALALGAASIALAWPSGSAATDPPTLEELALDAVSEDPTAATGAIEALRSRGPEGHQALMATHEAAIERLRRGALEGAEAERLRAAIDRVSGQRDGHSSGLYWHTDLDAARRAAASSGRAILSLRLLGRLDEELSCANSRFFRVVLYSDPRVAERLRDQYVLHWSTERPAPRIEIDMGDGRRMVRTITGNSVHYVLDAQGRPLDAIVGLYGPEQFLAALEAADVVSDRCRGARDLGACRTQAHAGLLRAQRREWAAARAGDPGIPEWTAALASMPDPDPSPDPSATVAMPLTVAKAVIETPVLNLLQRRRAPQPRGAEAPVEVDWDRVGRVQAGDFVLAPRTAALLRLKSGRVDVTAMAARLAEVSRADGARNELLFRRRVHRWFSEGEAPEGFEALNERIYRELLQTPASDPWLGLRADDLFDGLEVDVGAGQ